MAQQVIINFRDTTRGVKQVFDHQPRAGGSYSLSVRYEGEFVIVTDEWGMETAFPAENVWSVQTIPSYR